MPIQTDLSISPYFDDFRETSDYYKILFRPGVAVQTRELNQLQTLLQKQIERFGDNVFKRGTIVDGCDIAFHPVFPYVKIKDVEADGAPVNVNQYIGYNIRNQANVSPLVATITTTVAGFESQNPDLNTLYVRYINSGYANVGGLVTEQSEFAANQQLTVYDPRDIVEKIRSFNDSSGFSNTDNVVILSAIAVQNSTGGTTFTNNFYVGDHINDTTANVQIVAIDTTSNSEAVILRIKPRAIDLKAANSSLWTFSVNTNIQSTNATPSDVASIVGIVGTGARATLRTGALGEVSLISVTQKGSGYYVLPTVSIASKGATTGQIATANLVPQTFLTTVTVANSSVSPVGSGYAMSVGEGVVYQKGYFTRVNQHLVVVEKYANTPDLKAVGFDTTESIINSNQDQSLLDNATGAPNATAPGANRLKLTPRLVVKSKAEADANSNFLSIAEFSNGAPYKQNRQTVYNIIGNELSRRTYEESGNYVIDQFILNTTSPSTLLAESNTFNVVIDPGVAYINGKRVETVSSYSQAVAKGVDTETTTTGNISLNYGNYIRIRELGGTFIFKTGDLVTLYPTAKQYITTAAGADISASGLGTSLGTARIRSLVYESGIPGTAEAVYRLYLFDIKLATARNFTLVRSIFYSRGSSTAIADTVLENNQAVLKDNNRSSLLYYAGKPAVKVANNIAYVYRTFSNTETLASNGIISFSTSGGETFPYTGVLNTQQESDLVIVPLANVELSANISGSISCNTSSPQVNGTSTTFTSALQAGDFIKIANSSVSIVAQVNNIVNNTVLFVRSNPTTAFTDANSTIYFPQNVPISLDRSTRTANVNINSNTIFINVGAAVNVATSIAVAYNVRSSNTQPITKVVNRDEFVRLRLANNVTSNSGPWALGVPDVFRLKSVHKGPNATFSDTDVTNVVDITDSFYIDHNQTEDYYGISYLYRKPNASASVATTDFLLVKFDHFTDSGEGLKAPGDSGSYNIDDTIALANSTSSINTLEIPEVYGAKGDYFDLRDQFDFRPQSANTVAANTVAANAPINPEEPSDSTRFSVTDKKFPAPDSTLTGTIEYYIGRIDKVTVDENGRFNSLRGAPGVYVAPATSNDSLTINTLVIPPYPSLPYQLSAQTVRFADTKMANETYSGKRLTTYRITTPITRDQRAILQPRGYTMEDIGKLERRIADLEYYTSMNYLEAKAQKRSIPSSSDRTKERFKFGFFVDSFNNGRFSQQTHPGYRASVINGRLAPKADQLRVSFFASDSNRRSMDFNEQVFIAQPGATDGPVFIEQPTAAPTSSPITTSAPTSSGSQPSAQISITSPTILPVAPQELPADTSVDTTTGTVTVTPPLSEPIPTANVVIQSIVCVTEREKSTQNDSSGFVFEEFFYKMSETAGPAKFFINSKENDIAAEISQSSTLNGPWSQTITSASAQAITSADIITEDLRSLNDFRAIDHPGTLDRKSAGPFGGWLEDQFKLLWTHNPAQGQYYRVRVYKGKRHGGFLGTLSGKAGTYGFKLCYPSDGAGGTVSPPLNTGFAYTFTGLFLPPELGLTNYDYSYNEVDVIYSVNQSYGAESGSQVLIPQTSVQQTNYVVGEQRIDIHLTGLKPNTTHTALLSRYLAFADIGARAKPEGGLIGTPLVSDANGELKFSLFVGSDVVVSSELSKAGDDLLRVGGSLLLAITSPSAASYAQTTINAPGWVTAEINNPETSNLTSLEQPVWSWQDSFNQLSSITW